MKEIEKQIEEIMSLGMFSLKDLGQKRHITLTNLLKRSLTTIYNKGKEDEKEKIKEMVIREIFPDKYPSLSKKDGKRLLENLFDNLNQ